MACCKHIISLLLASFTIFISTNAENLIIGTRQPGDRLITFDNVYKDWWWQIKVRASKTFFVGNDVIITQVKLTDDNKESDAGATAIIVSGGPGFNFVEVDFESQRSCSIDYIVEIYGK